MKLINAPSPHWNDRRSPVDAIVLHADASRRALASVEWIKSPASKVSYHALIDRDGTVYCFVPAIRRAWHAGASSFLGEPDCNDFAIGVAFANLNDGREIYPETQLAVGAAIVAGYMRRFPAITLDRVTTHAEVAIPRGRKTDPAPPAFNLDAFRARIARELAKTAPFPPAAA